jgi:hypothetical protein
MAFALSGLSVTPGTDIRAHAARDLVVYLLPLALEFGDPGLRICLGAEDDLAEQVEDRVEPGFGADERALAKRAHPLQGLLHRGGRVKGRPTRHGEHRRGCDIPPDLGRGGAAYL